MSLRLAEIEIVFDKYPPSAKGKYQLTLATPYKAVLINADIGLYSLVDDAGVQFNVSTFGRTYTNGGNWHIVGQTGHWDDE